MLITSDTLPKISNVEKGLCFAPLAQWCFLSETTSKVYFSHKIENWNTQFSVEENKLDKCDLTWQCQVGSLFINSKENDFVDIICVMS